MATVSGYKGLVKLGANSVAQVSQWSFDRTADTQKVQWMGSADKTTVATTVDTSISVEGFYDPADSAQATLDADSAVGSTFTLELYAETATLGTSATGDDMFTSTGNGQSDVVTLTQFSITSSSEDVVKFTATFEGALVKATVA